MALINCPECNNQVSDQALKCTSCGKQLRKPKRSLVGKIIKWIFILFNVLMPLWIYAGLDKSAEMVASSADQFEQAGTAIGAGIGLSILVTLWVIGDIILGLFVLFTRPKS